MHQFHLSVPLPDRFPPFRHETPVLSLGSCFAEHLGSYLQRYKFPVVLNPFGILYNPLSLSKALRYLLGQETLSRDALFEHRSLWRHLDFHTHFAHPSREAAWQAMQASLRSAQEFLQRCDRLMLTFGTAFVYETAEGQQAVANCHQLPAASFTKRRLSPNEIVEALQTVLRDLQLLRPGLEVVLTVSPVRHVRDGVHQNQLSKAALLLACEQLCTGERVCYFPSYELLLDELRDYRFYARDRVHPSAEAVDYIWERFSGLCFPEETQLLMREIEKVVRASEHRPLHPGSEAHQAFVARQRLRLQELAQRYPDIDFSREWERLG